MPRALWAVLAAVAAGLALAGCGGGDGDDGAGASAGDSGRTLTVYSSLPLQGDSRPQSEAMVRAAKMALEKAGGRAGSFRIRYRSLDDATAAAAKWDPAQVSANARRAVRDEDTIAYLGEYNSGATAISLPITNEAGVLHVTPANTYVGLTRSEGAAPDEPGKYYPGGERTFGRVVPADNVQAAALVNYMTRSGCRRLWILDDTEVFGKGLAAQVSKIAGERGLDVAGNDGIDPKAVNYRSLADRIAASGADCFFFAGITQNNAVQVYKDIHAAGPRIKLFGSSAVSESAFTENLGPEVERQVYITSPTLAPESYPPAGRAFFEEYRSRFGTDPEPFAIYSYEAMSAVLAAIERAGDEGGDRAAVIDAFFDTRERRSVLGTYDIDRNGDTTLTAFGGNRVRDGALAFDEVIESRP